MKKLIFCLAILSFLIAKSSAQCGVCMEQVQLIQNGNFSSGNTGFTTDLTLGTGFFCPLCNEGTYGVGSNAWFFHSDFTGNDHTNPPSGNFFIANGIGGAGFEVWCQTVQVLPNTDYTFSFWARDVTDNPNPHPLAQLQPTFNGLAVGELLVAEGGWQQGVVNWNSGNDTSVNICLVNMETGTGGNDFGLDDISLVGCHPVTLSHTASAGSDVTICENENVQIGMPTYAGYNYSWTTSTSLNSTTVGSPNFQVASDISSSITEELVLTLDSANLGCISTDTILVSVLPAPSLTVGIDQTICPGETATIEAIGSWENFTWDNGVTSTTQVITTSGNYSATASFGACEISDVVSINFVTIPAYELGEDIALCSDQSVTLGVFTDVLWSTGENTSEIVVTTSDTYSFQGDYQSCPFADTINVAVFDYPIINLENEYELCDGESIVIVNDAIGEWNTGEIASSISVNTPGIYSITVTNGPCSTIDGTTVVALNLPELTSLEEVYTLCDLETSFRLEVDSLPGVQYEWSSSPTTNHYAYVGRGSNWVEVSNACGVNRYDYVVEEIICSSGLYIPTAFSPNKDQMNDTFQVFGYNISNYEMVIYNHFGDALWTSKNLNDQWILDPEVDPIGTYTYRAEYMDYMGEMHVKYGSVTVVK